MSLQPASEQHSKSVMEHGVCFGLAAVMLMGAAVGIQWTLHLIP